MNNSQSQNLKRQSFNPHCPSGVPWHTCPFSPSNRTPFIGCCASTNPCVHGCPDGNLRPGAFDSSYYGKFPDASCGSGSRFYTCIVPDHPSETFWGCCKLPVNPCLRAPGGKLEGCPDDLTGAFLDREGQWSAYGVGGRETGSTRTINAGTTVVHIRPSTTISTMTTTIMGNATTALIPGPTSTQTTPSKPVPVPAIAGGTFAAIITIIVCVLLYYMLHAKCSGRSHRSSPQSKSSTRDSQSVGEKPDRTPTLPVVEPGPSQISPVVPYGGEHNDNTAQVDAQLGSFTSTTEHWGNWVLNRSPNRGLRIELLPQAQRPGVVLPNSEVPAQSEPQAQDPQVVTPNPEVHVQSEPQAQHEGTSGNVMPNTALPIQHPSPQAQHQSTFGSVTPNPKVHTQSSLQVRNPDTVTPNLENHEQRRTARGQHQSTFGGGVTPNPEVHTQPSLQVRNPDPVAPNPTNEEQTTTVQGWTGYAGEGYGDEGGYLGEDEVLPVQGEVQGQAEQEQQRYAGPQPSWNEWKGPGRGYAY